MPEEKEPDSTNLLKVEIVGDKPIPVEIKGNLGKDLLATGLNAALGRGVNLFIDWLVSDTPTTPGTPTSAPTTPTTPETTSDNRPVVIIQQAVSSKIWVVLLVVGGIILGISQVKSCSEINRLKEKVVELEEKDCGNGK